MRYLTLVTCILFFLNLCSCQHIGYRCRSESDCDPWLACVNRVCTACNKVDTTCDPNSNSNSNFLSQCCSGLTCESIPGRNGTHMCRPNQNRCTTDADCSVFKCLIRIGKCGQCKRNGFRCKLPYDDMPCCSDYCRIGVFMDGSGICSNPSPDRVDYY